VVPRRDEKEHTYGTPYISSPPQILQATIFTSAHLHQSPNSA